MTDQETEVTPEPNEKKTVTRDDLKDPVEFMRILKHYARTRAVIMSYLKTDPELRDCLKGLID
jgi:hypothetical protein